MALGWLRWRAWAGVERGDAAAVGVAGVAFGDMLLGSTWQAWHSVTSTSTFVSRGRRGTYGIELAPVARLCRSGTRGRCGCWRGRCGIWRHAPWFHVAGVALGDIDLYLRFTWQAWLFTLRGRRGTWRHVSSLCVAGVALGDIDLYLRFTWQAWHVWHWDACHVKRR